MFCRNPKSNPGDVLEYNPIDLVSNQVRDMAALDVCCLKGNFSIYFGSESSIEMDNSNETVKSHHEQ